MSLKIANTPAKPKDWHVVRHKPALYHIIEALVRWIAPILSFTAEELWKSLPGERTQTVFVATWYEGLTALDESAELNSDIGVR